MLTKVTLLTAVVAMAVAGPVPETAPVMMMGQGVDAELFKQFNEFKWTFSKVYQSTEEELARFGIFYQNLQFINEHNARYAAGEETFDVGVNQFADWSNEEYVAWIGELAPQDNTTGSTYLEPSNQQALPDTVNWSDKGYVTDVKDQKQCGSCWSFSATGTLEGQTFKKTGKLIPLSEQNLVDCATNKYNNFGCQGGDPQRALTYVKDNKGIDTEESYGYTAKQGKCQFNSANVGPGAVVTGTTNVPANENALQNAVANIGPISVAIDASHISFQLYKSGVYNEPKCSSYRLDHAVLVTGYGSDSGKDYWLVKNSWNTVWGEKGYIKMTRNKSNQCGIATRAVYPLV